MAIIELPTLNQSRSQAMRNKTWIKRLDRVDAGERGGYAFIGEFEKFGATVEAEPGAWFLSFAEDRRAAGRLDGIEVRLYRVSSVGDLERIEAWDLDGAPGWALKVRDQVAAHLAGPAVEQVEAPASRKPYRVFIGGPEDYEARAVILLTEAEAAAVRYVAEQLNNPEESRPGLTIEEAPASLAG